MKNKGFTLIETLVSITLLATAITGVFKYQQTIYQDTAIKKFEYDYSKIIKGFENKLLQEEMFDKKYWTKINFNQNNYQSHLFKNLIAKNKRCNKFDYLDMDKKSFINCLDVVSFKSFNVDLNGKIFFDNNDFQYYQIDFNPKNNNNFKSLKKLQTSLKIIFNKVDLYSNIYFFNGKNESSFISCIDEKENCKLRLTFGTRFDYLEKKEIKSIPIVESVRSNYVPQYSLIIPKDENVSKSLVKTKEDINISSSSKSNIKKQLKSIGIEASNKEVEEFQSQINRLKNNPEFMNALTSKMEQICSQYDDDDYYFMSLYEKDNKCYQFKLNGIQ